ncbi:hypothetical protein LB518_23010 [Mesorhizobium sp. BR1-1-16]|uniref:hypothetical protein n=1 Tax=Mesorhizobium sp. BR1-1-16 TaxID=2876653 RepID=UPI001CCD2C79|nr:hypothetical protein [Mesorhizobium sp. BR1-1-16]MBZ9939186.1 hypothetical protein [Mesorhizobium sp. BR1-1-16]
MAGVFIVTYELSGDSAEIAEAHYAKIKSSLKGQAEVVAKFGATKFRPDHIGGIGSLFLSGNKAPIGWKTVRRHADGIEAAPNYATKSGREALQELAEAPRAPTSVDLARSLGWANGMVVDEDRACVCFATDTRVEKPERRIFVRLPRKADDGWAPPSSMTEVSEGEFMRALADHNAAVALARAALSTEAE